MKSQFAMGNSSSNHSKDGLEHLRSFPLEDKENAIAVANCRMTFSSLMPCPIQNPQCIFEFGGEFLLLSRLRLEMSIPTRGSPRLWPALIFRYGIRGRVK